MSSQSLFHLLTHFRPQKFHYLAVIEDSGHLLCESQSLMSSVGRSAFSEMIMCFTVCFKIKVIHSGDCKPSHISGTLNEKKGTS